MSDSTESQQPLKTGLLGYYHHKENDMSYGMLFRSEDGTLVFNKHKYIEINRDKKPPKVITEDQVTSKDVDETFFESFIKINQGNFWGLQIIDEQQLLKKMKERDGR